MLFQKRPTTVTTDDVASRRTGPTLAMEAAQAVAVARDLRLVMMAAARYLRLVLVAASTMASAVVPRTAARKVALVVTAMRTL